MADTNDAGPLTPPHTRLGRWRVASRLNLAIVFGFLCFAAISGLTFGGSMRLGESIDRLMATSDTVASVASIRLAVQQFGALQDRLIAQGSQANGDIVAAYEAESAKATAALKAASIGLSDGPDLDTLTDGLAEHGDQFRALAQSLGADPATPARPEAVRDIKELQGYLSATADSLADVAAHQSADTADRAFRDQRVFNLMVLGLGAALAILFAAIALYLVHTVTSPLVDLGDTAMGLARGQLMIEPPARGNLDDLGRIARGLEMMRKTLIEYEERTPRKAPMFRLSDTPPPPEPPEPSVLAAQLSETAAALSAAILRLKADAEAVAAAGEKAVSPLKTASSAASQAAAHARSLSVELPKVGKTMLTASKETSLVWEKAAAEVRRAIGESETLAEAPARMAPAIAAIRTIAEDARLLGLNASLQAARAAAGGTPDFDAVAQRLKALSRQAGESLREVETWVAEAGRAAPSTVAALWDVDTALGQLRDAEAANATELGKRAETIRLHGATAQQLATRASGVGTAVVAAIAEAEKLKGAAQNLVDAVAMLERDSQTLERSVAEDLVIPGFGSSDIFSPSDPDPSSSGA